MPASSNLFTTIRTEGGLLPPDLLERIATGEGLDGLDPEDYGLEKGERLNEAIAGAWTHAQAHWASWQATLDGPGETGISEARNQWLLPLFRELGYGRLTYHQAAEEIEGRRYQISHRAGEWDGAPPVHSVSPLQNGDGAKSPLDHAARSDGSGPRRSPHGLLQEYLNQTDHLWGVLTDGCILRLLRDNASLSRAAFVEADLEAMFREGVYSDFVLLYLLLHRSRLPKEGQPPEEAWLEIWRREGEASGARALDDLRGGVEKAIRALGQGFIEHDANHTLRQRLHSGDLSVQDYYRQLLRLVYRLLFLLAAEERDLLFASDAAPRQKEVYRQYYGVNRLRDLARRRSTDPHDDLWQGMQVLFRALREEEPAQLLGLSPLGGLFDSREMRDVDGRQGTAPARLGNGRLLEALRGLGWRETGGTLRRINYRDMDVEELGSVYEGLLEQQPALSAVGERTEFDLGVSGERKTTGSYYTNPGLVRELIRSALEPAIDGALANGGTNEEKRRHLLDLKVCDPACGSGHFLLAAARRIGRALAELDAGDDEPAPADERVAIREAIGHCIYGVDLNPLAVDLCKVALWLEGQNAGKPLQFLDHHIRHGNAAVGATAEAMDEGIRDAAFDPVADDNKSYAATIRKRNREERKGQRTLEDLGWHVTDVTQEEDRQRYLASMDRADDTLADVAAKEWEHYQHRRDPEVVHRRLTADLWTAAYFWPLQPGEANPPSDGTWRRLASDPELVDYLDERKKAAMQGRVAFRTVREAWRLAREHRFFHWELEFEDVFGRPNPGFDVVLGNPPWDSLSPDAKEFFSVYDSQVRFLDPATQRKLIESLRADPIIEVRWQEHSRNLYTQVRFFKESGRYRLYAPGNLGKGDFNIYRMFVETALRLARRGGHAAQFVPEGLYIGANAMAIRKHLFEHTELDRIIGFENAKRHWFPDNDSRLKFCLYSTRMEGSTEAFNVTFNVRTEQQVANLDAATMLRIPVSLVYEFSPDALAIMEFDNQFEIDIANKMYRSWPKFGDTRAGPPQRDYMREIDMGNDRHLFTEDTTGLPVYEGRMVTQYDHRAKGYRSGRGRSAVWEDLPWSLESKSIQPQWYVRQKQLPNKLKERIQGFRVGFCDVASPTNERTLVAGLIPPCTVCGDKVPTITFGPGQEWFSLMWLAVANSFAMDFLARKKVSLKMSYTVLDSLPFPRVQLSDPRVPEIGRLILALTCTSGEMFPFWNEMSKYGWVHPVAAADECPGLLDQDERLLARAKVEAIVAHHLFELSRDQFDYILGTFPIVNREDVKLYGEERMRRLCLEAFEYVSRSAREKLRTAVEEIEVALKRLVINRLGDDLSCVPEAIQEAQEPIREKNNKPSRATSLADFLGAGYLPLIGTVIRANLDRFDDVFPSNSQVKGHFGPLVALRNELAHPEDLLIPEKVRISGEREVRWFAEKLGVEIDLVRPPEI